jgi:hypothetical protein
MPEDPKLAKKGGKDTKKETKKEETKKGGKDTKKKDAKMGEPIREETKPKKINDLNYGIAEFNLSDLLKPNVRDVKLRSFVFPNYQFVDNETNNLELNT